jgi:hypothetical protein
MKFLVAFIVLVTIQNLFGQELIWESQIDSIPTLSSPRPADLTGDGVLDIVIGGGTDGSIALLELWLLMGPQARYFGNHHLETSFLDHQYFKTFQEMV